MTISRDASVYRREENIYDASAATERESHWLGPSGSSAGAESRQLNKVYWLTGMHAYEEEDIVDYKGVGKPSRRQPIVTLGRDCGGVAHDVAVGLMTCAADDS